MANPNNMRSFHAGIPQLLPPQDRALTWAYSACFHSLALAVASVAAVSFREAPPSQTPVVRLEILLPNAQQEAEQATATDSQAQTDPPTPYETATRTGDSSPIVQASSFSIVQRTAQRVTAETPLPRTTDRSTAASDQFHDDSSESIERPSDPSTAVTEPHPLTASNPTEAIEQNDLPTATKSYPEPIATNRDDHAESSPQPEASSSPPDEFASVSTAHTGSADSSVPSSSEIVSMNQSSLSGSPSATPDYLWLMGLLRRQIMSLQTYPHMARVQGWEGIVVVKTTIKNDGSLVEAVVTQSSGYSTLDQDALNLMNRVCPVRLPQDLEQPQIAILIPIRYRLER